MAKDARPQNVGQRMRDPVGVAAVGDRGGEQCCDAQPPLGFGQQHHPAVRSDPAAVERGGDLLAVHGSVNGRVVSSVMADVAGPDVVEGFASATESYATSIP